MVGENILKIKNLSKIYHTEKEEVIAVEDFSFELHENEFIAIVGPSGCGKSTILSILSGLETKSSGEITLKEGKNIGYMLQQDALFDFRTVLDNCLIGLEINKNLSKETKENVINLLNTYGLKDFINSYPNTLSGGMRQRVALIRTLATNPDIILLDEPFSALDYQSRLAVSDDVYNIVKKEKKSVIMVTHDIAEAISMADKVIVLTGRPSTVKCEIDINLKNKSTPINNRKDSEFSKYYDLIWKEIDYHV
ncbi:MAG: ABC transporter ATP-binding protein [Clostridium sp.]|nr:ABC transporter ATP-binding protein [Clostridium sp.]MCM1444191.1 ABC transporter ATP-binding protein [Candidatus Amulumruptor caecigallinarius]